MAFAHKSNSLKNTATLISGVNGYLSIARDNGVIKTIFPWPKGRPHIFLD